MNVTLKSGTNALKGSGYTYYRSEKLAETDFFVLKAGAPKPKLGYKRPGFTIGGPVVIPGLYDGHDRTFFFGAVEWLYDEFPEPLVADGADRRRCGTATSRRCSRRASSSTIR